MRAVFDMPVNFGAVMKRLDEKIRKSEATIPDYLCLSDHTSKWNMDVYLAVDKKIPGAENVTLFRSPGEKQKFGHRKMVHVVHNMSQMRQKIWQKLRGHNGPNRLRFQ